MAERPKFAQGWVVKGEGGGGGGKDIESHESLGAVADVGVTPVQDDGFTPVVPRSGAHDGGSEGVGDIHHLNPVAVVGDVGMVP